MKEFGLKQYGDRDGKLASPFVHKVGPERKGEEEGHGLLLGFIVGEEAETQGAALPGCSRGQRGRGGGLSREDSGPRGRVSAGARRGPGLSIPLPGGHLGRSVHPRQTWPSPHS